MKELDEYYEVWVIDQTAPRKLLFPGAGFAKLEDAMEYAIGYQKEYPSTPLEIVKITKCIEAYLPG